MAQSKEEKAAYQKAWREANKEKLPAYKRSWYANNKEKVAAMVRAYSKANKEKTVATKKAYYEANKKKLNAYKTAWCKVNKEKVAASVRTYRKGNKEKVAARDRAWREANQDRVNAYTSRRRALKRKLIPKHLKNCPVEKQRVLDIFKLCRLISKATGIEHHVDHMWPVSDNGPEWSGNMQIITARENLSKGAIVDLELKHNIQQSLKETM